MDYHFALGKYLGYPECCIDWFVKRAAEYPDFTPLTDKQEAVHGFNGFIPCPSCAEKVTKETIGALITDRRASTEYPLFNNDELIEFQKKFNEAN